MPSIPQRATCVAATRFISAALFVWMWTAFTAAEAETGTLTLPEVLRRVLRQNPELAAYGYELKASQGRITQASLRPNPELALELENFAGSGEVSGTKALETTLTLSQVIELGSKREARINVAKGSQHLIETEYRLKQLDLLAEATRRFIDLAEAQDALSLARETYSLREQTLNSVKKRVEAARSPEAELSRARIAFNRSGLELARAEENIRTGRKNLAAAFGQSTPDFNEISAQLFEFPATGDFEGLLARLQQNPLIEQFLSERRLRETELALARTGRVPNLEVGVGIRHLAETDDQALVALLSLPLPLSDRSQGAIAEAEALLTKTDVDRQAAMVRAEAELYGFHRELLRTQAEVEQLREQAIPLAQSALEQTHYGFERGRFSYLELSAARDELLELKRLALQSAAEYHRLLAEIERLTGEPVVIPSVP